MSRWLLAAFVAYLLATPARPAPSPQDTRTIAPEDREADKKKRAGAFYTEALKAEGAGDFEAAVKSLMQARELFPGTPLVSYHLGFGLQSLGRNDEAVTAFGAFLAQEGADPGLVADARTRVRELLTPKLSSKQRNKLEMAQDYLTAARQQADLDFDPGRKLVASSPVRKAIELFESLRSESPGYLPLYVDLGKAYELAGDKPKAYERYDHYLGVYEKLGIKPDDLREIRPRAISLREAYHGHRFNELMDKAGRALDEGRLNDAEGSFREAREFTDTGSLVDDRLATVRLMRRGGGEIRQFKASGYNPKFGVYGLLSFSPDGRLVAAVNYNDKAPPFLRWAILVWDVATGELYRTIGDFEVSPAALSFSPDSSRLIISRSIPVTTPTLSGGIQFRFWDLADDREVRTFEGQGRRDLGMSATAFSKDARWALVTMRSSDPHPKKATSDGIFLWNLDKGAEVKALQQVQPIGVSYLSGVVFTHGNEKFISFGSEWLNPGKDPPDAYRLREWDIASGTSRQFGHSFPQSNGPFAVSPNESQVIASSERLTLWDVTSGNLIRPFIPKVRATDIAFLPGGRRAVTVGGEHIPKALAAGAPPIALRLWDVEQGTLLRTFAEQQKPVELAVSPDGRRVLTSGWNGTDSTLRLWVLPP
jgi:WD40 repeat protein